MKTHSMKLSSMALAVSLAVLQFGAAHAEDAQPAAAPADAKPAGATAGNGLNLDTVVVTGTAIGTPKMKASVSISTLDAEQIQQTVPTSSAELLRAIPGVRSESSGGEGNANLTVRGVPISAGGARYVQFQEDGLPVLQFGDIAFGTPDSFLRVDSSLDRLEVVRGGSASTLATNSPGGIINFITKTGEDKGGSIGITKGLDFNQTRYDFEYGGPLTDKTRFYIGGFYRVGEGVRPQNVTGEDGGQIRGNFTQLLDNGYIRVSFKHLDDRTPTNLPVPVITTNGHISEIPGIDPRTVSFYSPYWVRDAVLNANNTYSYTDVNSGLHAKTDAFGVEASFKVGDGWNISDSFRKASNTGRFTGIFPADNGADGTYTYATGPLKGQTYTGRAFTATVFNTSIDDLGNTFNDLKLTKNFALGGNGKLATTFGLFTSIQNVGLTWNFNQYLLQAKGDNPALLTTASTTPGLLAGGTDVWGGCCNRTIDAQYRTTAPYVNLGWELGQWNVDGSLRQDRQAATGTFNQAVNQKYSEATTRFIDYRLNHTSYSVGGNYRLTPNLAFFARTSDGVAFNADRIMFNSYELNGGTPIPVNTIKQHEAGVKWRDGNLNVFLTLFKAKTDESNYEATTQKSTTRSYDAKGAEIEASYRLGAFRINGGLTYTSARIAAAEDASLVGKTPRRQADFTYQLTPSFLIGDLTLGAAVIGTTKSWGDDGNTIELPAFRVVNAFASYQFNSSTTLSISANNLFNTIGYTEVEGDGHAARSVNGRSIRASLKYSF
jgi:outer membrane receptor protein involved in Fe transport